MRVHAEERAGEDSAQGWPSASQGMASEETKPENTLILDF